MSDHDYPLPFDSLATDSFTVLQDSVMIGHEPSPPHDAVYVTVAVTVVFAIILWAFIKLIVSAAEWWHDRVDR